MMRRHLAVALVTAAAFALTVPVFAEVKVKSGAKLARYIGDLYGNAQTTASKEEIYVKLDHVIAADKKGEAMRAPRFWAEAIHAARFTGKIRSSKKHKKVLVEEIQVTDPETGKKVLVPMAFHGPAVYKAKVSYPLVLTYLEKGGDPKAFVKALVESSESVKRGWIVAAVAESDQLPLSKKPTMAAYALINVRRWFNIDSEKVFLQGIGATCLGVQKLASEVVPDRLAGIVLRNPTASSTNDNTAMFTTMVIGSDQVAGVYKKINAENQGIAANAEADAAMIAWIDNHTGRKLQSSYKYQTFLDTDDSGEVWSGTFRIESPGKRGEPIKVSVNYDRENNKIVIDSTNVSEFRVYMNDDLLDLDKAVAVILNGVEVANRVFERDMRAMFKFADDYGEFGHVFPTSYRGVVKAEIEAPPEKPDEGEGGDKDSGGDKKEEGDKGGNGGDGK